MKKTLLIQAPVYSRSGYGSHARAIVMDLFESGKYNISVAPTGWGGTSITDNFPDDTRDILTFAVNNKVSTESEFVFIHVGVPLEFKRISNYLNIGITAGIESNKLPADWAACCNQMDAVIVPSTFVQTLFTSNGVTVPVYVVGEGVDLNIFNPSVECNLLSGSDGSVPLDFETPFNFLSGGQWQQQQAGSDRKGIGNLISWFVDAFEDNKEVGLILKTFIVNNSSSDNYFTADRIRQLKRGQEYPRIYLLHGDFLEEEMAQLYRHPKVKAFVSPTSGEGWHRMLAEAISCDLPALVTGWSGHMDFVNPNYVTLFEYKIQDVHPSVWSRGLYEPGMGWAILDEEDVKRKMHRCFNGHSVAREKAAEMGKLFRANWSKQITARKLLDIFDTIFARAGQKSVSTLNEIQVNKL
jgi:glycosyltransferase involved in cell wall biosynthesis